MKKILFLLLVIQSIFGYGQYDYFKIEKPTTKYDSPYMFDVTLYGYKEENGNYIRIEKSIKKIEPFSYKNETTIRVLKEIEANRQFIDERFKRVYELIDVSNKNNYLRPGHLEGQIRVSIIPLEKKMLRIIKEEGKPIMTKEDSVQSTNLTPEQIMKKKKESAIARLGLLDLAINRLGKNREKEIDRDILMAVYVLWLCGGDRRQDERLKEDNLTVEWVFSLFARKEAFEATGWKPMYDDGTVPKEPVQKEEPEMDSEEITISF
jgi:hypothetical protein